MGDFLLAIGGAVVGRDYTTALIMEFHDGPPVVQGEANNGADIFDFDLIGKWVNRVK